MYHYTNAETGRHCYKTSTSANNVNKAWKLPANVRFYHKIKLIPTKGDRIVVF